MMGGARTGASSVTAVANAAAEAECPDGNDADVGGCRRRRTSGMLACGRSLEFRPLPTMLAVALATAMLPSP